MDEQLTRKQRKATKRLAGSSKAGLRAKSSVIDPEKVFIGSLNLDPHSVYENTEIGVVLRSPEQATLMAEKFDENVRSVAFRLKLLINNIGNQNIHWHSTKNDNDGVVYTDPCTGFWHHFRVGFMSIFSIESEL